VDHADRTYRATRFRFALRICWLGTPTLTLLPHLYQPPALVIMSVSPNTSGLSEAERKAIGQVRAWRVANA